MAAQTKAAKRQRAHVQSFKAMLKAVAEKRPDMCPKLFMLRIMSNQALPLKIRLDAARSVAPYMLDTAANDERMKHDRAMIELRMQHEAGLLDLRFKRAEEGKPEAVFELRLPNVTMLPLPDDIASIGVPTRRAIESRVVEPEPSTDPLPGADDPEADPDFVP